MFVMALKVVKKLGQYKNNKRVCQEMDGFDGACRRRGSLDIESIFFLITIDIL